MRTLLIRWLLLQACDVYSFGVLAWEVWEGEEPWAGLSLKDVWRVVVREGQRLPIQGNHITPLLDKCLGSPSQRVSITEVHTPTCIPAVCPKYVLKQLHVHYSITGAQVIIFKAVFDVSIMPSAPTDCKPP